jgi:hypothetical protein
MTARRPGSLAERVRAIGADHGRALALVAAEGQRTAEQTEALMTDHRDTRRILQDVEARVLVVAGTQGEMLSVFREMAEEQAAQRKAVEALGRRLATTTVTATEARSKASGAHRIGEEAIRRASLTEEQVKAALDAAAAQSKAIVASPPQGAELADLRREVLKGAMPLGAKLGGAVMLFLIAACVYGAAAFTSCSPGGP